VLRITVEQNAEAMILKLEGRVAGPWVAELNRLWKETAPNLAQRKLSLDLRETTYADACGIRVLQTIYVQTGAAILASTPWTQYLAEEVTTATGNRTELEG
jgi:anti-anti-sigma regulatory factor